MSCEILGGALRLFQPNKFDERRGHLTTWDRFLGGSDPDNFPDEFNQAGEQFAAFLYHELMRTRIFPDLFSIAYKLYNEGFTMNMMDDQELIEAACTMMQIDPNNVWGSVLVFVVDRIRLEERPIADLAVLDGNGHVFDWRKKHASHS